MSFSALHSGPPRRVILALLCLCLGACGFRLAGLSQLPESLISISLDTPNLTQLQRERLETKLRQAGAEIVPASAAASSLTVGIRRIPERTVVSSASTGKTIRRLARELDFSLRPAAEDADRINETLRRQTDIELDDDNLLSSDQQRADVIYDLEQALFSQLVFRLQRF